MQIKYVSSHIKTDFSNSQHENKVNKELEKLGSKVVSVKTEITSNSWNGGFFINTEIIFLG